MMRLRTDWEQVRSLLVLIMVIVAVSWAAVMCFLDLPPFVRAVITIAASAGALWAASAEWRPLTVSLLALTGVVLVGFIALSVGRSELERQAGEAARVQLRGTVVVVSEIEELGLPDRTTDPTPVYNAIRAACAWASRRCRRASRRCTAGSR